MENKKIAERLIKLRTDRNLSQAQVARDLNLDRSTICLYEAGERIPNDANKVKLAKYYDVSIESIFFK